MRIKRIIKNFKCRLDYACGRDPLRATLENLYFKDGFVYATDAYILVRHSLDIHGFEPEEISLMDGKMISRQSFKHIYDHNIVRVDDDGFHCQTGAVKVKYYWASKEGRFPDCEYVFKNALEREPGELRPFSINAEYISKFKNLFLFNTNKAIEMFVKSPSHGILLVPHGYEVKDQLGLIMPVSMRDSQLKAREQ